MISDVFRESSGHRGEGEVCGMAWVPSGVQMDVHEVTACKDPQSGEIEPRVVGDHCYSAPGGGERLRDGAATCFNVDADCLLRQYRGGVLRHSIDEPAIITSAEPSGHVSRTEATVEHSTQYRKSHIHVQLDIEWTFRMRNGHQT